jgi:dimethylargininase
VPIIPSEASRGAAAMRFSHALVRPPAATFAAGITSAGLGPPDLTLALGQHEGYCRTLERLGLALVRLPPDPDYPDSTFVEDTAVVARGGVLLTRPGAGSRGGEVAAVGAALGDRLGSLDRITAPGTIDGGDVCEAGDQCFIGRSERTNDAGAAQLTAWLARRRIAALVIDIRTMPGMLHLKTGLSWLGGRRLLAARAVAAHPALTGWDVVTVPDDEAYAANAIAVNGTVLLPSGCPLTAARLSGLGHAVEEVAMSEFRKMDGGLSCLSLRW